MNQAEVAKKLWITALKESGFGLATVVSGSMAPVLNVGDKVYVKLAAQTNYELGDIVVFSVADSLMVHRIVGRFWTPQGRLYIHRGDAAGIMAFGIVKQEHILGSAIIAQKDGKIISISSLYKPREIRYLSLFYSLMPMVLWLKRMIL